MNKQRKVLITITYNEMGIIIDTKAEEVAQPNLQPTCNQLATDCISRKAAIDTLEAQECQRAAQKRRYAFGNDEFSLEAAYHDCKLVFDGITDDDSFQEADTGLILYYANEIIYALHEALEGKGTKVLSNDCISRQAVLDWLKNEWDGMVTSLFDGIKALPYAQPKRTQERTETHSCDLISRAMLLEYIHNEPVGKMLCDKYNLDGVIKQLPSAQPEIILCKNCKHFTRDIPCVEGHYDGCDAWTDNGNEIMVAEDDFCSYAERREE